MPKNSNLLLDQPILFPIGHPFIELTTVDSTNNYAMAQIQKTGINHGTAYFAYHQTAGKGQRGKSWTSNPGENLILSVVLAPTHLKATNSFYLSATIANACCDFFKKYAGNETTIKWPNDIYWRDRKAGGILIENVFRNEQWSHSVAGIGININQTDFLGSLTNPVSLKQITGKDWQPVVLAMELCQIMDDHYRRLTSGKREILLTYNENLYKRGSRVKLRIQNILFETTIRRVTDTGRLVTEDATEREFDFGEVEWLL